MKPNALKLTALAAAALIAALGASLPATASAHDRDGRAGIHAGHGHGKPQVHQRRRYAKPYHRHHRAHRPQHRRYRHHAYRHHVRRHHHRHVWLPLIFDFRR